MPSQPLAKSAILMVILVISSITCWEFYLRNKGFPVSYNDDASLWSTKRKEVYQSPENATVFIGSSRIKYDLDIPTWENMTGEKAIQLAMVGTSPRPLLQDLADDKNFKGNLIIDITEPLFFAGNTARVDHSATEGIDYYKKWTPAQQASAQLNNILESGFVFLNQNQLNLNALLDYLNIPDRKGVMKSPIFPQGFENTTAERQNFMSEVFLDDTLKQRAQKNIWEIYGLTDTKAAGAGGDTLEKILQEVKTSVDKIKARGGKVLFVRTPSSGQFLDAENIDYPRKKYWDSLLTFTNCPGIHFADYPAIAHFTCPEWSHLKPSDAIVFTQNFIEILNKEKGWKFPKTIASAN